MSKQNKDIYISLMNRIAFAMLVNQGLLLILSKGLEVLKNSILRGGDETEIIDAIFLSGECVAYFLAFVLPVILFNKMNKYSPKEIYEPREYEKKSSAYAIVLLGMGLAGTLCSSFINHVFINSIINYSEFSSQVFWNVELNKPYQIAFYVVSYAVIPALVEEILFRGTVCRVLCVYGKGTAVVISAVLFALMHTNIEQLLYTFVAGLFFGWLYVETKSVIFPILMHFLNNFISVMGEILYQNSAPTVYEAYNSLADIVILIIGLICCVVFLLFVKQGKIVFKKGIEMKPDENGNEAFPLTVGERASGFLSIGMLLFVAYCVGIMSYFIYLSVVL